MKQVFDKTTVANYWANQRQQSGRVSAGNFFFEGRTIYSYGHHFTIAVISSKNNHIVLFTTCGYSNTTAKHISEARSAASHKEFIYCNNPLSAENGNHSQNINEFEEAARNIAFYLPKSKKPEIYLSQIAEQKERLMRYVNFFGIKPAQYKHLHYINIVTKDGAITATEKEKKQIAAANKKREKEQAIQKAEAIKNEQDKLELWKKFKLKGHSADSPTLHLYALKNTFLRFNKASGEIQTTKGVVIPIKAAERFYKWLKHQLTKGGCAGECNHKILGYDVTSVNQDGFIVGCHNVTWQEVNTMAKKLKWN